ncbi:copine-8 isoform X2 [Latimeria chalumnae]|uniref:copine-8 isoform X2 n=1 Tax=Latimeria chalumnae TaxID=7897 RepID=UPI0003C16B83|nr:PREDICTED: copine-8 isoform X2 [Latimeria chalumnae]|eukprot:XP_006002487.1 PREDICTED: copine-8 isoform X2 [Latimeria chalumnae]
MFGQEKTRLLLDTGFANMASIEVFDPFNSSIPATKVEVTVSGRNLLDRDTFSKSDPICVLYTQGIGSKEWREYGRTEVIDNTLNPDFVRKFVMDYFFEERQNLRFDLYDVDSKSSNLSKHDFLGQAFCTLGEIVGSLGSRLEKPLVGIPGKNCGTVILTAEELNNCRDAVVMQFCANKLDKKDFFGKSDPFMVFYRSNEDGTFTICHKTEVVKNTLNPVWQAFKISVRALCNGDYDRTIKVEVYDWERDGSHDFIGEFTTSYRELSRGQSQFNVYEVVNPKKKGKKKKYLNSGTVTLLSFAVETEVTFLDYIKGGTQINFTVAIDFTASNGNPAQPTSLHYMNPYQLNAYAMALKAVGEIIQDYDSDKMFPALGFGAKLPPDWRVSHEFALNGSAQNPYCNGIEGVMEAYYQSLKSVHLYGPTNFAPVINHVARYAASVKDGSQYFVLLIITDGVISDMAQTKESIVNASSLPMSIIIVGVGPAEFDAMVELDGDEVRLSSRGRYAERDIVQFVPFRDYIDRSGNHILSMARLAKDVLAEIPDQFLSYMKARGFKPPPAPPPYTPPDSGYSMMPWLATPVPNSYFPTEQKYAPPCMMHPMMEPSVVRENLLPTQCIQTATPATQWGLYMHEAHPGGHENIGRHGDTYGQGGRISIGSRHSSAWYYCCC